MALGIANVGQHEVFQCDCQRFGGSAPGDEVCHDISRASEHYAQIADERGQSRVLLAVAMQHPRPVVVVDKDLAVEVRLGQPVEAPANKEYGWRSWVGLIGIQASVIAYYHSEDAVKEFVGQLVNGYHIARIRTRGKLGLIAAKVLERR